MSMSGARKHLVPLKEERLKQTTQPSTVATVKLVSVTNYSRIIIDELDKKARLREMQRNGEIERGLGQIPQNFWSSPRPEDPLGAVREAAIKGRE